MKQINKYLSLVKFSHTIFAMPFALIGFTAAFTVQPLALSTTLALLVKVVLCMVFARNAAMAFNRYADRDIDALNPRTATREIPRGVITPRHALIFIILNCGAFVLTTFFINKLCFMLSPVALVVVLSYSLFKRFSAFCHVALGLALAIAPVGAYLAVRGEFDMLPILISCVVVFWTAGFDVLYAMQDREFDRSNRLHSIPSFWGARGALIISFLLHVVAIILVYHIGVRFSFNWVYFIGATLFSLILLWEHTVVKVIDLSHVNLAFATMNGVASILFAIFTIIALLTK